MVVLWCACCRLSRTEEGIVESVVAMKAATLVMGRSGTGAAVYVQPIGAE